MSIILTFPDGTKKEFPKSSTAADVAKSISEGLARNALAAIVDGKRVDLDRPIAHDATIRILTARDPEGLEILRHSCAHLCAQAVKRLYPQALQAIGPVIEHGFMFDFDNLDIGEDALPRIEEEMRKAAKERHPAVRHDYASAEEAKEDFAGNPYKLELIEEHEKEGLARYTQGDYFDLCRGPHIPHTGMLEAFALTKVTKAYWRGDAANKQLTRIYGLCFAKKSELEEHKKMVEQAQLRDHRKVGKELGLLMFHEYSPGAPFFLPKGATIYNELLRFVRGEYERRGYVEVITPLLYDKALWETSGHWEHYRENMFLTKIEGREFSLKPMNCPSHCLIYGNEARSYRDLPLRIADFASLHRNEVSGALSGLTRVRKFSQDDAHIFCTADQLQDELRAVMEFVHYVYSDVFRMEYRVELSTRPEKYLGELAVWERAEGALADVLKEMGADYRINPGDGAFYGPKIDIHLKDALGRSFQCATVQVDFQLPLRFGLTYEGQDGGKHTPVMIHRAVLGSLERFFGVLTEHFAGKFPLWLSPEQVRILPIADRHNAYAALVLETLRKAGIRATLDDRKLTTNKKVREGELERVNYLLVIGDREVESRTVNVRTRENEVLGEKDADAFAAELGEEIRTKKVNTPAQIFRPSESAQSAAPPQASAQKSEEPVYARLHAYLKDHGATFEEIEHPPAASAEEYHNTLGTRYEQQAKALLVRYKDEQGKGFAVVTLQAQKKADLEKIKTLLGAKELKMADKAQLKEATGCNFGELPPVGKLFGLKLVMDTDLLREDKIFFNAGRLDRSIALDPKEIKRIEGPLVF